MKSEVIIDYFKALLVNEQFFFKSLLFYELFFDRLLNNLN
jgi:hypothetical protein